MKLFGDIKKSCTFAPELIERLIQNLHSLLVISFSVINYVVSMRAARDVPTLIFYFVPIRRPGRVRGIQMSS